MGAFEKGVLRTCVAYCALSLQDVGIISCAHQHKGAKQPRLNAPILTFLYALGSTAASDLSH